MPSPVQHHTKIRVMQASSFEELLASSIDQELVSSSHSTTYPQEVTTPGKASFLHVKALQIEDFLIYLLEQPLQITFQAQVNLKLKARAL